MKRTSLYKLLSLGDKSVFDIPADEQRIYLNSLGLAKDNFERSYKQYLCQNIFKRKLKVIGLNIASSLLFPILIIYYLVKPENKHPYETVDSLGDFEGFEEIIPEDLSLQYQINNKFWLSSSSLSYYDVPFIFKIVQRYPESPFFCMKIAAKVAGYSFMIRHFNPKAIIVHNEYSFTSSILTEYCNTKGIKHINVMHGEKLFFIRDSYFNYNVCYVWNDYYKNLFISLCASPNQFIIAVPPSMNFNCNELLSTKLYADYKYYLAIYTEEQLKSIIESMHFARSLGKKVVYRPHPRYSNIPLLEKYLDKENIEYPNKVSIQNSISNAENIVGSYTTVLNQAYAAGKRIILDDVTYISQYTKLKEYRYIFSEKWQDIRLLSEMQVAKL